MGNRPWGASSSIRAMKYSQQSQSGENKKTREATGKKNCPNRFRVLADLGKVDECQYVPKREDPIPIVDTDLAFAVLRRDAAQTRFDLLSLTRDKSLNKSIVKSAIRTAEAIHNEISRAMTEPFESAKLSALQNRYQQLKNSNPLKYKSEDPILIGNEVCEGIHDTGDGAVERAISEAETVSTEAKAAISEAGAAIVEMVSSDGLEDSKNGPANEESETTEYLKMKKAVPKVDSSHGGAGDVASAADLMDGSDETSSVSEEVETSDEEDDFPVGVEIQVETEASNVQGNATAPITGFGSEPSSATRNGLGVELVNVEKREDDGSPEVSPAVDCCVVVDCNEIPISANKDFQTGHMVGASAFAHQVFVGSPHPDLAVIAGGNEFPRSTWCWICGP